MRAIGQRISNGKSLQLKWNMNVKETIDNYYLFLTGFSQTVFSDTIHNILIFNSED